MGSQTGERLHTLFRPHACSASVLHFQMRKQYRRTGMIGLRELIGERNPWNLQAAFPGSTEIANGIGHSFQSTLPDFEDQLSNKSTEARSGNSFVMSPPGNKP